MVQLAGTGIFGSGCLNSFDQLFERGAFADVHQLVGIRHPEIDAVFRLEFVTENLFAVDVGPVAAAQILEHPTAIYRQNLSLLAADAAVAQREFGASLASNAKGRGGNRSLAANAVG